MVGSAGKDTQELCVAHHASYAINLKTFLVRILSREPLESQQESDVLTGVGPDWQSVHGQGLGVRCLHVPLCEDRIIHAYVYINICRYIYR